MSEHDAVTPGRMPPDEGELPASDESATTGVPVRARVRVTSPRTSAARTRTVSIASEIDEQTRLGEVYITSLMRSQLRLALEVLLVLGATLGLLPLAFHLFPAIGRVDLLGVPLPWLLLTVVAFAEIITLGWVYVRRAERNEATFSDLLEGR
ncbi:hypothetical protein [Terrabacter terrigena]|uniref:DUF485 domain-containing protein n=1 Tax=Terrabacter terrigena TaxID=574718 RepID=A0ABW3MY30_9MICO